MTRSKSTYSEYLKMNTVPAGAVLKHILRNKNIRNSDFAKDVDMIPQRISDLIHGNRRFTPEISLKFEKAIGIDIAGFFYLIQSNNDIHLATSLLQRPNISVMTRTTFWDMNPEKIDWHKSKQWVIHRILDYGTPEELSEILRFYGKQAILDEASQPANFRHPKRVLDKTSKLQ